MASRGEPGLVEQLKAAIRDSGLSLNQISQRSGVGTPTLSRFMRGKRTLTLYVAERLCRTLGLDLVRRSKPDGE